MKNKLENFSWLISENIFSIFIGLFSSMFVVRYLGPENNGIINYCFAYVSLCSGFADLGTANVIQKEEVIGNIKTNILVGTGLIIGLIGGMLTVSSAIIAVLLLKESRKVIICVIIIGCSYIFKSAYIIRYILLARLQAEKFVKINIKVQIIMAFIKVFLVIVNCDIYSFACCYVLEAFLQAVLYYKLYTKSIDESKNIFSLEVFIHLIKQSWPNIIATFAVVIYMKSDQIMIGRMLGNEKVGIYSVAVTVSEFAQFIPGAIATTMLRELTVEFNESKKKFEHKYINYFEKIILLMCIIIIGIILFSNLIVTVLYGKAYIGAVPIIKVYAISGLFSAIGVAEGAYINLYKLQKESMVGTCIAAMINIILNYVLINIYGAIGAAFSTILAMFIQSIIVYLGWKETRNMLRLLANSIKFKNVRKQFAQFYISLKK